MMRIVSRHPAMAMLLLVAVFIALICLIWGTRQPQSSAVVAFQTDVGHSAGTISVYSQRSGTHCVARSRGLTNTCLVGYDAASATWVLDSEDYALGRVGKLCKGKMSYIHLADFPVDGDSHILSLSEGALTVSTITDEGLMVYSYDLRGSLKSTRVLKVPRRVTEDRVGEVAVSSTGDVAACLVMRDTMRSELCIFDGSGRLKEKIGGGGDPEYSPDGLHLAYKDYVAKRDQTGGQSVDGDEGTIVIYDLRTKARKKIAARTPPGIVRFITFGGIGLDEYYWSADGKSLICSYTQEFTPEHLLYSIDISSSRPKWHRLPFEVMAGSWTVLDKMPPAACKP
jgi:hypothetical protein